MVSVIGKLTGMFIAVGFVTMMVLAFLFGALLPFQIVSIETNTQQIEGDADGWKGRGTFKGPDGVVDEICDATMYVTSWSPNLDSEKVVCAGYIYKARFLAGHIITQYRYRVFTSTSGLVWNERSGSPHTFDIPNTIGNELAAQSILVVLRGTFEGGIRVQFELRTESLFVDKGWKLVASDQAYLKSGIGNIEAPDQATVGDTIKISWVIPYVTSEKEGAKGWALYGYSLAQKKVILGPIDLTQLRGSVTYKVSNVDFQNVADCRNELEWVLRNELWERDFKTTTVIDISKLGPSVAITGVSEVREAGTPVTVKFDVKVNPATQSAITKIIVKWGFGGIDTVDNLTASARAYTFTPGGGGRVHLEVIAYDGFCRPSPTAEVDIHIREPGQGDDETKPNWIVFVIVLALFALIAIVAAVYVPGPPLIKIVAFIGILLVGLLIAIVLVPEVLLPTATAFVGVR